MRKTNDRADPARDFLESVRDARFEIRRSELKLEEIEAQATSITAQMTGMPGGGGDVHKDSARIALAMARSSLEATRMDAEDRVKKVEGFISLLSDVRYRAVLTFYYVHLFKWPRVVEELEKCGIYYSDRHIFRLHGKALKAARELWAELHPGEGVYTDEDCNCETEDIEEVEDR